MGANGAGKGAVRSRKREINSCGHMPWRLLWATAKEGIMEESRGGKGRGSKEGSRMEGESE